MKSLWLLLSLPALVCATPVTLPSDPTAGLGMNIHFTDPKPGELEMLAATGVRWVRMDFLWGATERSAGQYDFAAYERLLAALDKKGMHALFILDYSNKLYEPENSVRTPAGREAFARWAAAAVTHFKGRGVWWEIWNEPNGGFWKPQANVAEYAELALAASKAIRAAAPGETILGPATSTIDMAFLEGCGTAGLFDLWDAVSVHPYRQEGPEAAAAEYARLRRLLAKYRPLPIISGEWGYSSAWKNFDAEKQGKMLPREWLINIASGVPLSIWYDWHEDGTDPREPEHHFGTVEHAYQNGMDPVYVPKPAYLAAQKLVTELRESRFLRRLGVGGAEDYVLLFQHGEGLKLAAWTTAPAHSLTLPSDSGTVLALTDTVQYVDLAKGDAKLSAVPARAEVAAVLEPLGESRFRLRVENLQAQALSAEACLIQQHFAGRGEATATAGQPLVLAASDVEKTLTFPQSADSEGELGLGAKLLLGEQALLELPARRFSSVSGLLTGAKVRADGDGKVASEQTVAPGDAPLPMEGSGEQPLRLEYRSAPGWKFFQIQPASGAARGITGRPHAFGLWIYGDGQSGSPRLRVVDADGKTWQPSGPAIDWKGWRYVELQLTPETAHWGGGKAEGIAYPLKWDALFLLDLPREREHAGTIWVARPWVIE